MSEAAASSKEMALESIITTAVQIPGVKVNRKKFLAEIFAGEDDVVQDILDLGPIQANVSREKLQLLSSKLIFKRTSASSLASFVAGVPGGLAMAATIPADVLQFFGMALRLAQELSYLYGAEDLWNDGHPDSDKIQNQLILYCGVMFGVSGAVSGVRVISTQLAKTALKKLPQKALTKTFWYPIIKQIGKALSIKVTKTTVANGISKAIPIIGGVISGTINFASMMPMADRLQKTLDKAVFDYTDEEFEADVEIINDADSTVNDKSASLKEKVSAGFKKSSSEIAGWMSKKKQEFDEKRILKSVDKDEIFDTIAKMKKLLDANIITQEEFDCKKNELLSKIQ
ncbi:MAG: SHOCT domain-containing protein [Firmicutes bacterium]|nr:SHOCT domain-containing protein [Bacillota bacterium]